MKYFLTIIFALISLAVSAQLQFSTPSEVKGGKIYHGTVTVAYSPNSDDKFFVSNVSQVENTKETTFTIHRYGKKLDATLTVVYFKGKIFEVYITEPTTITVVDKREYFKYRLPIMLSR